MNVLWIERALWVAAIAAATGGTVSLRVSTARALAASRPGVLPAVAAAPPRPSTDSMESAVETIADHNLFRPERASAEEPAQGPAPVQMGMPMPAPSTKPRLVLRGVIGGPALEAIIEGIPGHDGAVVLRAGQSVGGITLRSVRKDTAYARGFDTTWALPLARSW
jgi:hypothetical protein